MDKNNLAKQAGQVILFAALGALIMYFMWQGQGEAYLKECAKQNIPTADCSLFDKLITDFREANWFWLLVISLCFALSQLFRALRWQDMLQPMGYHVSLYNSLASILVGYFANLGVPRIGEFVRAGLLSKYEKVPVEKAFASIVVERIVDVIMLLVLLLLGFVFHYDTLRTYVEENTPLTAAQIGYGFLGLVVVGLIGLIVLRQIMQIDERRLSGPLIKLKKVIESFVDGVLSIRDLPNVWSFIAYSVGIWVLYFLMHYLAFFAYEPVSHLSAIDAILIFDFGSLGIVFPSPGGMGSYHFMIVESMKVFGIDPLNGFSFAMISFFTVTIFCTVLLGMISLILLPIYNRK